MAVCNSIVLIAGAKHGLCIRSPSRSRVGEIIHGSMLLSSSPIPFQLTSSSFKPDWKQILTDVEWRYAKGPDLFSTLAAPLASITGTTRRSRTYKYTLSLAATKNFLYWALYKRATKHKHWESPSFPRQNALHSIRAAADVLCTTSPLRES